MSQLHQFIENLVQPLQHYQSLNDDAERSSNHVHKQLDHINALLADQLSANQQVIESLIQLRSHYQSVYSQQQQKANNAREQLNHVTALLADQAVLQHSEQHPVSIQSAILEQQRLTGASDRLGAESQTQEPKLVQESKPLEISEQQITLDSSQGIGDGAIAARSKESPPQDLEVAKSPESLQLLEPQIPLLRSCTKLKAIQYGHFSQIASKLNRT